MKKICFFLDITMMVRISIIESLQWAVSVFRWSIMKIGELSKLFNIPRETIRFYEKEGLIIPPNRNDNNYRSYSENHIERLRFIDLITNLADRYLNINCACFTPNEGRIDDILRYVKEYNIDGVVYSNLSFCHTYSVEYNRVEKALKEAGIPMINIETDYSIEDSGQIKTRVEAFIEMI